MALIKKSSNIGQLLLSIANLQGKLAMPIMQILIKIGVVMVQILKNVCPFVLESPHSKIFPKLLGLKLKKETQSSAKKRKLIPIPNLYHY